MMHSATIAQAVIRAQHGAREVVRTLQLLILWRTLAPEWARPNDFVNYYTRLWTGNKELREALNESLPVLTKAAADKHLPEFHACGQRGATAHETVVKLAWVIGLCLVGARRSRATPNGGAVLLPPSNVDRDGICEVIGILDDEDLKAIDSRVHQECSLALHELNPPRRTGAWSVEKPSDPEYAAEADAESPASEEQEPTFIFRPDGDGYFIAGFGESGHLKQLKGLNQIYRLLGSPRETILLLVLDGAVSDLQADDRSIQPVFDAKTKQELWRERRELDAELVKARENEDLAAQGRIETEISELTKGIRAGIGLRGKDVDLNNEGPGLRSKIWGTLNTAYDKLRKATPPMVKLADHLEASIHWDGNEYGFVYRPDAPIPDWQTEKERSDLPP